MKKIFTNTYHVRKRHKLSQEGFAEKIGITQPYYSAIESGKKPMQLPIAMKISELFNVELGDLLSDSNIPKILNYENDRMDNRKLSLPYISTKATSSQIQNFLDGYFEMSDVVVVEGSDNYVNSAIIEQHGNSMGDRYSDRTRFLGDLISKDQYAYQTGLVAIAYPGHFVVRRIKDNEIAKTGLLTLYSDNLNSGSFSVKSEDISMMYKLKKVIWSDVE